MSRKTLPASLCLVALLGLGACAETVGPFVDGKVSYYTEKDCSYVHLTRGQDYCKEKRVAPPLRCERTLGDRDCYAPARLEAQPPAPTSSVQ